MGTIPAVVDVPPPQPGPIEAEKDWRTVMKLIATTAAAALLAATPALAQVTTPLTTMPDFEVDADGMITEDAFVVAFVDTDAYEGFDVDGDGELTGAEFRAAADDLGTMPFSVDMDGDETLTEAEFYSAAFATYDLDGDGMLNADERVALEDAFATDM